MRAVVYRVQYTSVDGSGFYPDEFTTLGDAMVFAQARQAESDAWGNAYGYWYRVLRWTPRGGEEVYRTR